MTQLDFFDWLIKVEDLVTSAIASCHPRGWNENHITYSWLKNLQDNLGSVTVRGLGAPFSVAWDAYKVDGRLEAQYGDVAVLVEMRFTKRRSLSGVAFLEAKRFYSTDYRQLDWKQLTKQSSTTANHRLLLYDTHPVPHQQWALACHWPWLPYHVASTRAVAVPTTHALSLRSRTRKVHALGVPFAFQLCTRYLRGLDLDHSSSLVRDVALGAVGGIRFLFVATVAAAQEREPRPERVRINGRRYIPLRGE